MEVVSGASETCTSVPGEALWRFSVTPAMAPVTVFDALQTLVGPDKATITWWQMGVRGVIAECGREWNVTQLGCRAEYRFQPSPARNGTEANAASDPELERYLHLHALNRGVLITPFHNMALMAPTTTESDVDRHTEAFDSRSERSERTTTNRRRPTVVVARCSSLISS